jgi:opacity protein-like surface antigen
MSRSKAFILAGAATLVFAAGARAADYPPPSMPPLVQSAPSIVQEFTSGWYLRGDLGYRLNSVGDATPAFGAIPVGNTIDDSFMFGGGGGYKANWFRADVTLDYGSKADYTSDIYRAQIGTFTTLGNLYVDLGTWWGITPYIGAGAGMAYVTTHEFVSPGNTLLQSNNGIWNFAWAYMGGFAYRVGPNLLLDASYRRIEFGEALSPLVNGIPAQQQLTINDLAAHEFRVGIRYTLD